MKTEAAAAYPLPDTGSTLVQVSGALTLIILLILLVAWLAKRLGFVAKHTASKGLAISASVSVGARERLVIAEVENARLVLGVTSQQITCLHTLPPASAADNPADTASAKPDTEFSRLLKQLLRRNRSQ